LGTRRAPARATSSAPARATSASTRRPPRWRGGRGATTWPR
jgi:hypothetical protein